MLITGIIYQVTDTFPVVVMESTYSLLLLEWYLLPRITLNRYLLIGGNKNCILLFYLGMYPLLDWEHPSFDFVMIH